MNYRYSRVGHLFVFSPFLFMFVVVGVVVLATGVSRASKGMGERMGWVGWAGEGWR